ncbi:Crp/Fnr family transcriptional regulator [Microbacter margulisiae]|uniref:CRP/FNR family transcriptional regulator n=1 Tax=Microbacter margulisiae TaxID=1350067 RepID=A0A7W5DNH5_9PORP|nr:Crp/Fnr family transcriptional regulator [Microbacter margulisiae]MBB3186190.1 CRP/FNR family transcriptional regulator [Microbacter margulisiae]
MDDDSISRVLIGMFGVELTEKIQKGLVSKQVAKDTIIVHEGQYVDSIPFVIEGYAKILIQHDGRSFLIHYVKPYECCVMPFAAISRNIRTSICAISGSDTLLYFIPNEKLLKWIIEYPVLHEWFYHQYETYERAMLDTIRSLLFDRLDIRLLNYLHQRAAISGKNYIPITHKEIASDMGTVREVITRTLLKLQKANKVIQHADAVEILPHNGD